MGIDKGKAGKEEKIGMQKLSFFIGFCIDTSRLNVTDKNKLKAFVLEKGKSEFKYIEICNSINFKKLFVADLQKK